MVSVIDELLFLEIGKGKGWGGGGGEEEEDDSKGKESRDLERL